MVGFMKTILRCVSFLWVASLLVACGMAPSRSGPAQDSLLALGQQVYQATCARCHGSRGEGQIGPALDRTGHAWHHPDQQIRDWIQNGKLGLQISMPGYSDELGEAEIEAVVVFIKTWWDEEQRRVQADVTSRYRAP
ncbi:MAG: cytochrome c [Chloroflexi bacterium]|nr:cytochrome c [Chloroflexota bacterium]